MLVSITNHSCPLGWKYLPYNSWGSFWGLWRATWSKVNAQLSLQSPATAAIISGWICDEGLVRYCGMFFSMTVARADLLSGEWDQVLNLSLDPVVKTTIAADVSVAWHQKGREGYEKRGRGKYFYFSRGLFKIPI